MSTFRRQRPFSCSEGFRCSLVLARWGPSGREWRDAGRQALRTLGVAVASLGIVALTLYQRLAWSAHMVRSLAQPGVAGWSLDVISPLAILGLPGTWLNGAQVEGSASH